MSPTTLSLLIAFLFISLVASVSVNDDSSSIASALMDAAGANTVVPTTPKAGKVKFHSSNSTSLKSNSTANSASGRKMFSSSKRPSTPPMPPPAGFTAGLGSIVPVTAVVVTLAMVGFRLYLNKIEDEYELTWEKHSEWAEPSKSAMN